MHTGCAAATARAAAAAEIGVRSPWVDAGGAPRRGQVMDRFTATVLRAKAARLNPRMRSAASTTGSGDSGPRAASSSWSGPVSAGAKPVQGDAPVPSRVVCTGRLPCLGASRVTRTGRPLIRREQSAAAAEGRGCTPPCSGCRRLPVSPAKGRAEAAPLTHAFPRPMAVRPSGNYPAVGGGGRDVGEPHV